MKKYFTNISLSVIFLFIATLLLSLLFTIFTYTNIMSNNVANILIIASSSILFFLFGFIYGRKMQKKGLLNGIILILIYGLVLLVYYLLSGKQWTLSNTLINLSRAFLLLVGSIFGVNTINQNKLS